MSRFPLRFLALVALCSACGESPDPWIAAQEQWFERVEFAGRSDMPEFLIVWDGTGAAHSRLVDSVQFALWSDGVAVWRGSGLFAPPSYRTFRCTAQELADLRSALSAQLPGPFVWEGPVFPCSSEQLALWRTHGPLRGVCCEVFLEKVPMEPSWFGRLDDCPTNVDPDETARGWARLGPDRQQAVRARLAIEAAVTELVGRHPEARATSAVRLVVP